MTLVELRDAGAQLEELIERAAAGEEIALARDGKPAVLVVPIVDTEPDSSGGSPLTPR
jgi:prevent-host-death family protein